VDDFSFLHNSYSDTLLDQKSNKKFDNDLELIEQAIDISVISQISFWDSLIIAAAEKSNCEFVFSEDLNTGQTYRGVMVITDPATIIHTAA